MVTIIIEHHLSSPYPRITYDQANALCYQMQGTLHDAVASLHDPAYIPEVPFPLVLGPRIEKNDQPCPTTHFQGMIAAAREMHEWAAGLIAQYDNAVTQTDIPIPLAISAHLSALRGRLAQADSHLRFGTDMAGQASQGKTSQHLHEETENVLWNALQQYFLLNQVIAMPQFLHARPTPVPPLSSAQPQPHRANVMRTYHDRSIQLDDLWRIASPSARQELRGTRFGTDEMQVKHLSSTYANNRRMIPPIPISLMCYNSGLVDPLVSLLEFPILLRQQLIPQYTTSIVSRFRCLLASNVLLCYTEGEGKASKRALMPRKKGSLTIF